MYIKIMRLRRSRQDYIEFLTPLFFWTCLRQATGAICAGISHKISQIRQQLGKFMWKNNKEIIVYFCLAFIRLTAPSLAQGFYSVNGEEEKKVLRVAFLLPLFFYGRLRRPTSAICAGIYSLYINILYIINAMRLRRSRQTYNGFITTFILLGLLEEAHQRNMRWNLLTTCKFRSKMK